MQTLNDVHHQFASFFPSKTLQPYAYLVSKKLSEGHICLQLDAIEEERASLPQSYRSLVSPEQLMSEGMISTDSSDKQPFMLHNNMLYMQRYFQYETMILDRILSFIQNEEEQHEKRMQALSDHAAQIRTIFDSATSNTMEARPNWQLAAAVTAVLNDFTIITGGPGTGKTTTVANILSILFAINPEMRVALAAPTGKAAARMAESLKKTMSANTEMRERFQGLNPSTIHRLLGYIPDSPHFRHNRQNPLNYDLIIVDEASMIDVAMFAKLLDAIGPKTRLILLGDKDQLASVEAGSLFGDLCQAQGILNQFTRQRAEIINSLCGLPSKLSDHHISEPTGHPLFQHIVELRHSHRFSDSKGIGKFSKAIIGNDQGAIGGFLSVPDEQVSIDTSSSAEFQTFVEGYEAFINEPDIRQALHKLNNLRVLCAVREGEQGVYATNRRIEGILQRKKLIRPDTEFYENRPVIITGNNYSLGLYNGDIGIIRRDADGRLKAWFENSEGELRDVLPGYLSQAETVFAMTIHKSQGSEFNEVLVLLPSTESMALLTGELLYTAVTRARQKVLVQGSEGIIRHSAATRVKRASGIAHRFSALTLA